MCGIVYVKRKDGKPAYKSVLKRYRKQEHRGTEGYGYVAIKDNKVVSYHRAPTEHEIIKHLEKEDAPEILFHHRNPTSTPNLEEEAHPILVENPALLDHEYFVAHNGVIRNSDELKKEHELRGFKYTTEMVHNFFLPFTKKVYREAKPAKWNDSESLAIETALALDGEKLTIDAMGYAAVIGLQVIDGMVVNRFFYKNLNPLKFHEDKTMVTITSQGHGTDVETYKIFRLKSEGGFEQLGKVLPPKAYEADTPGYKHTYTPSKRHESHFPSKGSGLGFMGLPARGGAGPYGADEDYMPEEFYAENIYEDTRHERAYPRTITIEEAEVEYAEKLLKSTETYVPYPSVKRFPMMVLHDQWSKCVDFEKEMKDCFVALNVAVATRDVGADGDEYLYCEKLEARIKRVEIYREALEKEIFAREFVIKREKTPAEKAQEEMPF